MGVHHCHRPERAGAHGDARDEQLRERKRSRSSSIALVGGTAFDGIVGRHDARTSAWTSGASVRGCPRWIFRQTANHPITRPRLDSSSVARALTRAREAWDRIREGRRDETRVPRVGSRRRVARETTIEGDAPVPRRPVDRGGAPYRHIVVVEPPPMRASTRSDRRRTIVYGLSADPPTDDGGHASVRALRAWRSDEDGDGADEVLRATW